MPALMVPAMETAAGFAVEAPADFSDKATRERLSPTAIKLLFRVAKAWELKDEQARALLGGMSNGTFYKLKGNQIKALDQDALTRVSLLVGIFKALNILFSERLADRWMTLPNTNPMFGGEPPVTYAIRGGVPALARIRQLLDARRGGR